MVLAVVPVVVRDSVPMSIGSAVPLVSRSSSTVTWSSAVRGSRSVMVLSAVVSFAVRGSVVILQFES